MSYDLQSFKGVTEGILQGSIMGVTKGDTRYLDYGSHMWGDVKIMVPF